MKAAPELPPRVQPAPMIARPLPKVRPPTYYVMRQRRDGPLLPARLQWLDHEPEEPDNKLDRGYQSVFPQADIGGALVDPERILERLFSYTDTRPGIAPTHWKYPQPCTEAEYRLRMEQLRWAERNRPDDPKLRPRKRVESDSLPLPNFDRENSI